MPWWNFLQPVGTSLRKVGQGINQLDDNVAALMKGRTPGINGQFDPASVAPMTMRDNAATMPNTGSTPPEGLATRPRRVLPQTEPDQPLAPLPPATRPRFADRINQGEYDYVNQHGKRGWKEMGLNTLAGFLSGVQSGGLAGGIGGAATGAAGGLIAPQRMAAARFQQWERPQIEGQINRERTDALYGLKMAKDQAALNTEQMQGQNYENQIQLRNRESDRQDVELQARRPYWEAQAKEMEAQTRLRMAQTEAAKRGTPVRVDLEDKPGQVNTYNVYPNGDRELLGASARAAYERQQNQTSRANTSDRIAASERNVQRRLAAPTGSKTTSKYVSKQEVEAVARSRGVSYDEALTGLRNEGYQLTPGQRDY